MNKRWKYTIIPVALGILGTCLALSSYYILGKSFETGISHGQRLLINIIAPVGFAPVMVLEALGINFHRAGFALMTGYFFSFWFIVGILGVALWNWIFHRKRK